MKKRMLSLLVCLCMLASALSVTALAAESEILPATQEETVLYLDGEKLVPTAEGTTHTFENGGVATLTTVDQNEAGGTDYALTLENVLASKSVRQGMGDDIYAANLYFVCGREPMSFETKDTLAITLKGRNVIFIQAQADEAVATALVSSCPVSVFGDGFLYVMAAPAEGSKASCAGFNVVGDLTVGASVTCMVTGGTAMALNGELTLADGATLRWPTELKLSEQADTQTALSSRVLMNGETAADMAVVAAPSDPVTRGVAVFNLWRMKGSPKPEGEYPFSDEAASDFLQDAIHWAGTTGIAKGYGDGAFGANDPITNEQFALMAYRLRGCPAVEGDFAADYPYAGSFSPWAREAVLWCGRQGSWDPQDILTHGTLDRLVAGMSERD